MAASPRTTMGLATLLAALLIALLPAARPAAAQTGTPPLSSAPQAVDLTVALGSTAAARLDLHNDTDAPVRPRLFEAVPPGTLPSDAPPRTRDLGSPAGPLASTAAPLVDPQIAQDQAVAPAGESEFLVFLDDQADLAPAYRISSWAERGAYVYQTLTAHAEASQRELRSALEARGLDYTPLWIVNALAVHGDAGDVAAIAAQAGVAELRAVQVAQLETPPASEPAQSSPAACGAGADYVCWNLTRIGASRAWNDFGVRGEGVTVANIDSGVRFDHPALLPQYRGSSAGTVTHDYNWFDAYGSQPAPIDSGNHGTHTMGTMVGRGLSPSQPAVGVAPGARWIAVRACSARDCSEVDLIRAAQWLLAPTNLAGANPRPDLRPHVVNNSWTGGQNASWYASYVNAWRASGIYPVFAAGNAGNQLGCGTIQSPGDYAQVTAVGATDSTDHVASFSSIGPTADGRVKPDLVAPGNAVFSTLADQRAYGTNSGTSMATPHVAGAVALLWAANPQLIGNYEATYAALTASATPMTGDSRFTGPTHAACRPETAPNNIAGYGRLDVYTALAGATVDVPWMALSGTPADAIAPSATSSVSLTLDASKVAAPGVYQARVLVHSPDLSRPPTVVAVTMRVPEVATQAVITGQVTRAADGAPLRATVLVAGGSAVRADADGRYSLTLPPATAPYTLSATARDHITATRLVTLTAGLRVTLDFSLETDQPRLAASTAPLTAELGFAERTTLLIPVGNSGSRPLSYTLALPSERYGIWRSDEPDGPAPGWTDPPPEAESIPLTDDGTSAGLPLGFDFPFYGQIYDQAVVMANGVIALTARSGTDLSFAKTCLPLTETAGPAIAPLRVDLDPSRPGARVSFARLPAGALVSWENVPLYNNPAQRLSFQALLMPDGRISLRYKSLGTLAPAESPSIGLQHTVLETQTLGCKADLPIENGLTVELRPQVPGSFWMSLTEPEGSVAPSSEKGVPLLVRWAPSRPFAQPMSAAVELRSNDPASPLVRFTVRLRTAEAPHRSLLTQLVMP